MMPVPATLTSYLPVLLVSVTNHAVPDDTSFSTQPEGQVDYLSHEWKEEDVWRSWRSMTRQKNAIANGMRLENASWRTWWKQRNKLKTISPETLNWLKDSDVTWLYGPLHTGSDWSKAPQLNPPPSPAARRQSISTDRPRPAGKKPILKRRSISQLLSLPASPFFHGEGSDSDPDDDAHHLHDDEEEDHRPPLLHTKSDTHISSRIRAFRKESPPRIVAPDLPSPAVADETTSGSTSGATSSSTSTSTGSDQDLSGASIAGVDGAGGAIAKKKHISFNTFVEQCIAIEKPKRKYSGPIFYSDPVYEEGYSEDDSEVDNEDDGSHPPTSFYINDHGAMQSDSDEDDEDEVLEIKSRRSRSSSSSRSDRPSAMRTTSPPSAQPPRRPAIVRQGSVDREHMTIAPIAPTILKSTGVGNSLASIGEDRVMRSQKEVELVYVPPSNSIYSLPGTPNVGSEDVYHHRESYFSIGTPASAPAASPYLGSRSADSSPTLGTVGLPLHPPRQTSHSGGLNQFFASGPVYDSPASPREVRDDDDEYDYFGGPYQHEHEEFQRRHHARRGGGGVERMEDPGGYAPGRGGLPGQSPSQAYWRTGTSSAGHTPMSRSPRIVVNEVAGATEEREEMSSGRTSPVEVDSSTTTTTVTATNTGITTTTQSTTVPQEVPRKADVRVDDIPLAVSYIRNGPVLPVAVPSRVDSTSSSESSAFLSPSDTGLTIGGRGRSPVGCSPTSGSTTTGTYSLSSGASDSRSESRGRSSTRNSSSECDRSGSRSSRGTNSPLGSISPTGSGVGIGGGYGFRGRDREGRGGVVVKTAGRRVPSDEGRGRDRTGRRIGDSLSPPNVVGSPSRSVSDEFPAYSPVVQKTGLPPPPSSPSPSVSGSSVSGSSTASGATAKPGQGQDAASEEEERRGRPTVVSVQAQRSGIPSPIPEEEETRSRQPTPANSPVRALSHHSPVPPSSTSPSSPSHNPPTSPLQVTPPKSRPSAPETSPSEAQATPSSPTSIRPPTSPLSPPPPPHSRSAGKSVRSPERNSGASGLDAWEEHQQQQQGLVGRAAEIVSQARGFLGSIWNSAA